MCVCVLHLLSCRKQSTTRSHKQQCAENDISPPLSGGSQSERDRMVEREREMNGKRQEGRESWTWGENTGERERKTQREIDRMGEKVWRGED